MYWSGVQSTGAEMRKYFTIGRSQQTSSKRIGKSERILATVRWASVQNRRRL